MSNSTRKKNSPLTSILLITESNRDQLEQLLDFLINKDLVSANPNLETIKNLPNIHLYNQDEVGLKIETVRKLIGEGSFSNINKNIRVFAILNAEQSSGPAQNALLKIVEEPPINTQIILISSQPKQILPTIRSRCLNFHSTKKKKLSSEEVPQEIVDVCQSFIAETDQSFSYSKAIELSEKYKKREDALYFIEKSMTHLHSQLRVISDNNLSKNVTFVLEQFLKAYQDLQKNFNTQLTLENYLFNVVNTLLSDKRR